MAVLGHGINGNKHGKEMFPYSKRFDPRPYLVTAVRNGGIEIYVIFSLYMIETTTVSVNCRITFWYEYIYRCISSSSAQGVRMVQSIALLHE